jgi:hypothetical protein
MIEDLRRQVSVRFPALGLDAPLRDLLAYMANYKTL